MSDATAHVSKQSGELRVEMGWGDEPPLAGSANFVEVEVSDASGAPVAVAAGALTAEVAYGDVSIALPLAPGEAPGELQAELVPTRPGTYAFHVTGTVRGHTVDARASCSERTFECVSAGTATEFPVKDPSPGELSQRLSREADRVARASKRAGDARKLAIAALAVGAMAPAAALGPAALRRRGSGPP